MKDLIERLLKAAKPSRQLDALIEVEARRFEAYRVGLNDAQRAKWKQVGTKGEVEDGGCRYHAPEYTRLTDSALGVVPKGAGLRLERYWLARREAWSAVASTGGVPSNPLRDFTAEDAATPAIALCIVGLKASEHAHTYGQSSGERT